MGAVARLIAHHISWTIVLVDAAILVAALVVFGAIWLRERRRRVDRSRSVPEMRE